MRCVNCYSELTTGNTSGLCWECQYHQPAPAAEVQRECISVDLAKDESYSVEVPIVPQPDPVQRAREAWEKWREMNEPMGGIKHAYRCPSFCRPDGICACNADELTAALDALGGGK